MKTLSARLLALALTLLLLFTLASCGSGATSLPGDDNGLHSGGAPSDEYYEDKDNSSPGSSDISLPENRVIIKTVHETIETLEYDKTLASLEEAVLAANGYFSSSHYRDGSYNRAILRTANLVIRIPADKLSAFCKAVEGVGHVTHFQETIDDITLSYVAIESRIEVLESEETALMTMLAKAESISDMLAIRKQLEGVQGELASLRAQKRVYDDQVAYSTVNMTVHEVKRVSEDTERMTFGQEIGHTFSESLYALGAFFRGLSVFFIGNSPVLLLLAALVACGVILVRRILRKRKMAAQKENDNKE